MMEVLRQTSKSVFVPLTIGGGIQNYEDARGESYSALEVADAYFRSGADKISIGTDAVLIVEAFLESGLASVEALAAERGAASFAQLAASERAEVLHEAASRHPGLLEGLVFHTYTSYYQQPQVVEALGLEARPPYPKGYELEPGDLGGLDAVRSGPPRYRAV